ELRNWTSYPKTLTIPSLLGEDRDFYHRRLLEDASRLFKDVHEEIEVICGGRDDAACSVIKQAYTWDQFAVGLGTLQMILTFHQIFAPFLDCVHSFGIKISENDESWNGYRKSLQAGTDDQEAYYEFCYTVRYVIPNERPSGPAWSIRRSAVYQQYRFRERLSKWILLQPSIDAHRRFTEVQAQSKGKEQEHPMRYHVVFLFSTAVFWKDYIMHLRSDLEQLVRVLLKRGQNLRQRLLKAVTLLDASLEVARACVTQCREIERLGLSDASQAVLDELEVYISQMMSHKDIVTSLLEHSRGTMELLFKILEFRNSENIGRNAAALHKDVGLLRDVAFQSKEEGKAITKLAQQNRSDTRSLKALSILGTLYLPATFMARRKKHSQPREIFEIVMDNWVLQVDFYIKRKGMGKLINILFDSDVRGVRTLAFKQFLVPSSMVILRSKMTEQLQSLMV
ncbi:MAG: hypothetical protein Q9181_008016, partial [Wetmoreana brouardii]